MSQVSNPSTLAPSGDVDEEAATSESVPPAAEEPAASELGALMSEINCW
jgi:hypothetical protein